MRRWLLPAVMVVFALISVLTLKSVAPSLATQQLVYFLLGGGVFWVVSRFEYRYLESWQNLGYAGLLVFLIIPLLIGKTTRGIAGWIDIGPWFSIQPSQLAIPIVGLLLSNYVAHHSLATITQLAKVLALILIPAVLILIEPDLGTTIIYLGSLSAVLFVADTQWKHLLTLLAMGVCSIVIAWVFLLKPYQKDRIVGFVSPTANSDASYNARQAVIAVGSGGLFGRGLGQGVQSHLRFLPERQTDFIFASFAEEWGFVGSVLVVGLYATLVVFCIWIAWRTTYQPAVYYCLITAVMITLQAGINMGMNMGIFPITGITLPLLSYGGSSVLALCAMFGVVWTVVSETRKTSSHHFS